MTEDGQPGPVISTQIPATSLADAFDRVAAMKGKRWRFDGEKVYLLGGREWTIPMPANRDLAIAVKDALASNQVSATIQNNMKIGRASCRARVCQYVYIWVVAVSLKKTQQHK